MRKGAPADAGQNDRVRRPGRALIGALPDGRGPVLRLPGHREQGAGAGLGRNPENGRAFEGRHLPVVAAVDGAEQPSAGRGQEDAGPGSASPGERLEIWIRKIGADPGPGDSAVARAVQARGIRQRVDGLRVVGMHRQIERKRWEPSPAMPRCEAKANEREQPVT